MYRVPNLLFRKISRTFPGLSRRRGNPGCGLGLDVSVLKCTNQSQSRLDKKWRRLGLVSVSGGWRLDLVSVPAIYASCPRHYFRPKCASHIDKMSQISSRYLWYLRIRSHPYRWGVRIWASQSPGFGKQSEYMSPTDNEDSSSLPGTAPNISLRYSLLTYWQKFQVDDVIRLQSV